MYTASVACRSIASDGQFFIIFKEIGCATLSCSSTKCLYIGVRFSLNYVIEMFVKTFCNTSVCFTSICCNFSQSTINLRMVTTDFTAILSFAFFKRIRLSSSCFSLCVFKMMLPKYNFSYNTTRDKITLMSTKVKSHIQFILGIKISGAATQRAK